VRHISFFTEDIMTFRPLPIAYFGRKYFGAELIKAIPSPESVEDAMCFKQEIKDASNQLRKASQARAFQKAIVVEYGDDFYYRELFKRQLYADLGVIAEQSSAPSKTIMFQWHFDNPYLNDSKYPLRQFYEQKFPGLWQGFLGNLNKTAQGPEVLTHLLSEMQRRGQHTDRSIIVGKEKIHYHGFLLDAKSNFKGKIPPIFPISASPAAVIVTIDFLYNRVTHIPHNWSPELLREIQAVANCFHLNFLSHIADEAAKRHET
jgi:hypothetical protein